MQGESPDIHGYPLQAGRATGRPEAPANRHLLTLKSAGESLDRTQEVAGSSPASSISERRCTGGAFSFGGIAAMEPIGAPFQALVPEIAAIAADRRGLAPIPARFAAPPELWSPTA
jgi:hypothetical protein